MPRLISTILSHMTHFESFSTQCGGRRKKTRKKVCKKRTKLNLPSVLWPAGITKIDPD